MAGLPAEVPQASWFDRWLPGLVVLASPWVALSISLAVLCLTRQIESDAGLPMAIVWYGNLVLVIAGAMWGAMKVRGPLSLRLPIGVSMVMYAAETYSFGWMIATNILGF